MQDGERFVSSLGRSNLPGDETFRIIRKTPGDAISLTLGEPDFAPPKGIDFTGNFSGYSPPEGFYFLREAICKKLEKRNSIFSRPENVVVAGGSTEAMLLAFMATLNRGDEVILPDPGYVIMPKMIEIAGGVPVALPTQQEENFNIDPKSVEKLITDRTKIIFLNSPSNPTGSVLTRRTMERIADIAMEHDLLVFSDEAYEDFVYEGRHKSIGSLNGMENRTVSFYTFSKTWCIPGFRLGYLCAPESIAKAAAKFHIYTTFCASTHSQAVGKRILDSGFSGHVKKMRREYKRRGRFLCGELNNIGLETTYPRGGFYTFSNISECSQSSVEFAYALLEKANVAVLPGSEFGAAGEGYIRCSFCTPMEKLKEGTRRIESFLSSRKIIDAAPLI